LPVELAGDEKRVPGLVRESFVNRCSFVSRIKLPSAADSARMRASLVSVDGSKVA